MIQTAIDLRRIALILLTLALCGTTAFAQRRNPRGNATPKRANSNAVQAVSLLEKLDSAVSLGISPFQYAGLVVEVVPQVQEALAKVPEGELRTELALSLTGFIDLHKIQQTMSGDLSARIGISDYLITNYGVDASAAREFEISGYRSVFKDLVLQNIFAVAHNNLVAAMDNLAGHPSRPYRRSQSETQPSAQPSETQSVSRPSVKCSLDFSHAVELRGFRLRIPLEEIQQRFPGAAIRTYGREKDENPTIVLRSKKKGDPLLDGRVVRPYSDATLFDASQFPDYEGVAEIVLTFVSERVASVEIAYENNSGWKSTAEFVSTISEKLHLPQAWIDDTLSCDGWSLKAETYPGVARLRLSDLAATGEVQRQRDEKRRAQEAEDEKKRKVFKP